MTDQHPEKAEQSRQDMPIVDVLGFFSNNAIQNVIIEAASAQDKPNTALLEDESSSHQYGGLCFCCSDSRENVRLDSGDIMSQRNPGNFVTHPDGNLTEDAARAVEKAVINEEPVITVRQHSRCGAMAIIHAYHSKEDGEAYVSDHYGEAFATMAKRRANLYNEVRKTLLKKDAKGKEFYDFSVYEKRYGIPLSGEGFTNYSDDAKFQTCMAIQQGVWDHKAILQKCQEMEAKVNVMFVFKHVAQNGRIYTQKQNDEKFIVLPQPKEDKFDEKLEKVLALYPESMHHRLKAETVSQQEWVARNEEHLATKTSKNSEIMTMAVAQAPQEAVIRPSGRKGDESSDFAKAPGQALFLRLPDGIIIHPDGKLKFAVAQFLELNRAYGVPVVQFEQNNTSSGLRAIYQYHKDLDGEKALENSGQPSLVAFARDYAFLYTAVRKRIDGNDGMSFYEAKRFSLGETEEQKFVSCMAIELALMSLRAIENLRAKEKDSLEAKSTDNGHGKNAHPTFPEPILLLKSVNGEKRTFVYAPQNKNFIRLPILDENGDAVSAPRRDSLQPFKNKILNNQFLKG